MPRRRRNLPLWLRLLVRRLRSPEGRLASLAVISIAVSVTLATGLEMASRSAESHLQATAEAIRGAAEIEVTAGNVGLPEELLEVVRATPGVRAASPLVSVKVRLVDRDFALNVIGVDLLAEELVRKTAIERNGLQIRDPLRLLATPSSVVVTESLLDHLGLGERYRNGESVEIRVKSRGQETSLVVQGTLRTTGVAAAFGGQVAVMDVYAAQMLGGRVGLFDRIDVVPNRNEDVPALTSLLGTRLAGMATVQRSSARSAVAEDLLQMVRKAALMLAGASALVACLLTYATTAQWVERQKRQLATLRAVGMEARRVQTMIVVEVTVLAILGTSIGVFGGVAISPPLLATLSNFLEVVAIEPFRGVTLHTSTLWVALAVGVVASVAGSALPARRAGLRFTLDSLDVDGEAPGAIGLGAWLGIAGLAAFALISSDAFGVFRGSAMIRVGVLLPLGAISILALAPLLLHLLRVAVWWTERSWPAVGHLATRFFRIRPWTFAVALTAISALVGTLVTVFLLISTISSAVDRWAEARFPGASVLVLPFSLYDPVAGEVLSPETLDLIRTSPGVVAVNERYKGYASVLFRGQEVQLEATSADVVATHGRIASIGRSSVDLASDLCRGMVAVSPGFVNAFGLTTTDSIELDTLHGFRRFEIAGIFEDFGESTGSILVDIETFDSNWTRSGATSAVVWIDVPNDIAVAEIRRRVGARQDLFFANAGDIKIANRRITEVFTSTLHVLGAFVSVLGAIGVMILLAGIIAERRRDLAVLRAAGAEPRQLVALVLADALALGLLGAICGVSLGLACADPATDILRESFGWILEQRWYAPELPAVVVGTVVLALLGALLPARMAYRTTSDEVFGPE